MMPNITRGGRLGGLMVYLAGPGKRNEHTNPHVVAGHDVLAEWSDRELGRDDALDIANALDLPRKVHGTEISVPVKEWDEEKQEKVVVGRKDAHVWHCSLSLKAEEGELDDETWGAVARDFVAEMGFAADDDGCRWVAVRHGLSARGNDHIHVVVNLVREDGTKARVHDDQTRSQKIANRLEHKYRLKVLESREAERGAQAGAKPAEVDRAARGESPFVTRNELRRRLRAAAAGASDEREFLDRLRDARLLVRPRYASGGKDHVVGYSVALVPEIRDGVREAPVWFGGGKLDKTLTLGQLRARWGAPRDGEPELAPEWSRRWQTATVADKVAGGLPSAAGAALAGLSGKMRDAGLRVAAADAAGILAGASLALEKDKPGPLAEAADIMARAAQSSKYDKGKIEERAKDREAIEAAYSARLLARGTGRNSVTGWIAVLRQAQRTMKAIARGQEMQGRLQAAAATSRALEGLARAVPQINAATPPKKGTAAATRPAVRRHGQGQENDGGVER